MSLLRQKSHGADGSGQDSANGFGVVRSQHDRPTVGGGILLLVIDANRSEDRGEKLSGRNSILGDIGAVGICAAVNDAAPNPATRQGHAPASSPVIAPAHGVDLWSSPHFRERDDKRILDETTLLQIFE